MSADPPNRRPKVFISYAHESDALRASVRALADRLGERGCEVVTDHPFIYRPPEEGWLTWMLRCLREADTVLVVCTPKLKARYEKAAPPDEGFGATYEGAIVTQQIYDQAMRNTKFFPILPDGGNGEDIPTTLRPWSNRHQFPSGDERILKMVFGAPSDDRPPISGQDEGLEAPTLAEQLALAIELLEKPGAAPFVDALHRDIAAKFPAVHLPHNAIAVAKWFAQCEPPQVQPLFNSVRRALGNLQKATPAPDTRRQSEHAAAALYCLAACRLVDQAAGEGADGMLRVPNDETVTCAVIATALFGGRIELVPGENVDQPCCRFVYQVTPGIASDQQFEDFERAVFVALFGNSRETTKTVSLDCGALTSAEREKLASHFNDVRNVHESSLALVIVGSPNDVACRRFRREHGVPIMLPRSNATTVLLGMSAERLLEEIKHLWKMVRPPGAGESTVSRPPTESPAGAQPMSQPNIHVHASDGSQVSINTGDRAVSLAGSHQTAQVGHRQGSDLTELWPILAELLEAVAAVSSARAREKLAPQIEVIRAEAAKGDAAEPKLIESTLKAVKSGAEFLDDGGKIISLCNKAYQVLAPVFGLPPSPLP